MIKMGICWCKPGVMSRCTALCREDQKICDYYDNSYGSDKCMHRNEMLNNHCWSVEAQRFAIEYGVRTPEDIELPELEEEEMVLDLSEAFDDDRRCDNCILYACSYIISENSQAQPRGGLTMSDLEIIAKKCPDFESEASMQSKINQSLRGTLP